MVAKFKKTKKRTFQTIFFSIILAVLIVMIASFLIISNWKMNQRRAELRTKIEELKKEIQILEEKNKELEAGISQVETREYLEKVAKEQLNLKNPGEEVVVITKEEGLEKERKEEKKSFWQKIWEKIGF